MKKLSQFAMVIGLFVTLTACGGGGGGGPAPANENSPANDPTTQAPGTQNPGTQDPGTQDPGTQDPGTQDPGTQDPGTQDPGTQDPGTQDPPPAPKALTIVDATGQPTTVPRYVADGTNASLQYWLDNNGALVQSLYKSKTESVEVRVIHDPTTGHAKKIIDVLTGNYVVIKDNGDDSVDFLEFDANNNYVSGRTVRISANRLYVADTQGRPIFLGQLTGALTGDVQSGSFTLIADVSQQLVNESEASADVYKYVHGLVSAANGTAPGTLNQIEDGELTTVRALLPIIGLTMVDQPGGNSLYGTAGAAISLAAYAPDLIDEILGQGGQAPAGTHAFLIEQVSLALSYLVDGAKTQIADFWTDVLTNAADPTDYVNAEVSAALADLGGVTTFADYTGTLDSLLAIADEPQPADGPTPLAANLNGQAALTDNATKTQFNIFSLSGTIAADGTVSVTGQNGDGSLTITISGTLGTQGLANTTFNLDDGLTSGTVTASEDRLGSCDTGVIEGFSGTYTFSHYIGYGNGVVDFTYQTGTKPDSFSIVTAAGERYALDLVTTPAASVPGNVSFLVNDEPVLFLTVVSPGVSWWSYKLSCSPMTTVTALTLNNIATAAINTNGDRNELFSFTAPSTGTYNINLDGTAGNDFDLMLWADSATLLDSSTAGSNTENLSVTLTAGTTYYVEVRGVDTKGVEDSVQVVVSQ